MDPQTRAMFAAGHSPIEDEIADFMEVYGADGYREDGEFLYLYRGNEYITYFERKRR